MLFSLMNFYAMIILSKFPTSNNILNILFSFYSNFSFKICLRNSKIFLESVCFTSFDKISFNSSIFFSSS